MSGSSGTTPIRRAHALPLLLLAMGSCFSPHLLAQDANAVSAPSLASAQASLAKRAIDHAAYAGWRSIQGTALSRDGQWAAYALVGQESDGELVLRRLTDGQEWRVPRGTAPVFSADGRFVAYAVQPSRAELDKAKKDKKKGEDAPKPGAGWLDLSSGKPESLERVKRFAWAEEGGTQLALLLEPVKEAAKKDEAAKAKTDVADEADDQTAAATSSNSGASKKKEAGSELVLINAATGHRQSLDKEASDFVWARSGQRLAYALSVKEPSGKADAAATAKARAREGVYLLELGAENATPQALTAGAGSYKQLAFDRSSQQLAWLSNRDHVAAQAAKPEEKSDAKADTKAEDKKDKAEDPTPFKLFLWRADQKAAHTVASAETAGLPAGWGPSEHGLLSFSKDGQRLFLGTAPLPKAEPKDAPEPIKVDLWHWKDPELQSVQKVKADKERQRNYRAVLHLPAAGSDSPPRLVQLARTELPTVVINDNAQIALGLNDRPYQIEESWSGQKQDAYAVDLNTGEAKLLARKLKFTPKLSPTGRYVLGYQIEDRGWWAWDTRSGQAHALTAKLSKSTGLRFDNEERDTPGPAEPYGSAGWTEGDASVVLYDRYDLWAVQLNDLSARNLSQGWGRKNGLQLRQIVLDSEEPEHKPLPTAGLMLGATHLLKRDTGFYQLPLAGGQPQRLLHADKLLGTVIKAKQADTLLYTQQSFSEFPDLWASTTALAAPKKISQANPQQADYLWGTQELMDYTSADGKKLQALLAKPANFDPAKKYPVMVYIYEKMTDKLHNHVAPAPGQNINPTRYASQGYLVLRPDVVFSVGHPGQSAMNTVLPAVRELIKKGYADPKRVGIQGHSWGAYQINYMLTRTNMFRAAEAGASMANMVSGYGGIRWGTGISRAVQYEQGQSRIGATPWDKPQLYIENSPIFQIHKVQTPYLTVHNDEDDAVPFYQAIEFFTALRRLGKEAYWFNYNGEKHGLRERDNIKHYSLHMTEFFDHYLLDAPRPGWMDQPVPWLERGKRDVSEAYKPKAAEAVGKAGAAAATSP
ncbi:alpha/beta hydrolase family protein [Paucibacter sp. DJ2R-2]|uniref:alpha/beta hydrolase family protein n=1 Tax=Paucibacter sp. DJ2R-2 TaxID=2893558 RepID=UPI0021E3589C|nr:prolyl oligopeptidase family serine peptidase [Paucibacter sp. DJ2R-2]MCV2422240.1 prolyl oligopeptidase family serine peptidase [Paucibacter sp. DJ4R-1]MCV2440176.1 prolyl oligopeptidase family serine peptidase [Paucibacter sp. DJ2R-2]